MTRYLVLAIASGVVGVVAFTVLAIVLAGKGDVEDR